MQTHGPDTDYAPDMGAQDPAQYNQWFCAKVQASRDDPRPSIPHEQVMANMRALLRERGAATPR